MEQKWSSWCIRRKIFPIRSPISCILDFLADRFKRGLEYNTVGSYKSAISAFHDPIDGQKLGEHPGVSGLLADILHQRLL